MRRRSTVLGKVVPESYWDFIAAVQEMLSELEGMGFQELNAVREENEPAYITYSFLNGLGYLYGARVTKNLLSDLDPRSPDFQARISAAVEDIGGFYNEARDRLSLREESTIRQAAEELQDLVPGWLDLDSVLKTAQESYGGKGVYLRDFYHNLMIAFGRTYRALRRFLLEDERPEMMIFQKEEGGGEFIPEQLVGIGEEEERKLLKEVIKEANRRIRLLGFYGTRLEPIPRGDFTVIQWLNGPAAWRWDNLTDTAILLRRKGTRELVLDANVAIVPFHSRLVTKVLDVLENHPLYVYSSEAKERGEYPVPTDANVKRAIRSIIEQQQPDLDPEELSVEVLLMFDLFKAAKSGDPGARQVIERLLALTGIWLPYARLIEEWLES